AQEGDGRPNAMDRRLAVERVSQVKAKALLRPSTQGHYDVLRTALADAAEQFFVLDGVAVLGRDVAVFFVQLDSLPAEPGRVAARALFAGHDPEAATFLTKVRLLQQL